MKFPLHTTILACLLFFGSDMLGQWMLRDTTELQIRDGLPNYFEKIKNGHATKVGYIGGSITSAVDGWRPRSIAWMKNHYSNNNVIDYSAAIGGTNSKYGVFRIDLQLLEKDDYDLIFIEYSLNDNPGTSSDVEKSIEGMIRKIWLKNPRTDICFVFTLRDISLVDINNGKMPFTASKHDSIASYYNIPSIFCGVEWSQQLESGIAVMEDEITNHSTSQNASGQYVFTVDGVHPSNYGAQVYTDIVSRSLTSMDGISGVYSHDLKEALVADNFIEARMIPVSSTFNHGMDFIDTKGEKAYLDDFLDEETNFMVSDNSDEYYSFSFHGNIIGLNLVIGPSSGRYFIEVDGDPREFTAFDGYSNRWRKNYMFLNLVDGEHDVRIYRSNNTLNLAEKENILIYEDYKEDIRNNPEKYETNEIIFSDVFVEGNLTNIYVKKKSLCEGDSILWEGSYYSEPGKYEVIYQSSSGQDSIHQLELSLTPLPEFSLGIDATLKQGETITISVDDSFESYLWNDNNTSPERDFNATELGEGIHTFWLVVTDINLCQSSDTINITVLNDSSSTDTDTENAFVVYPNPTVDVLHVSSIYLLKNNTAVSIYTLTGTKFYEQEIKGPRVDLEIDLSAQAAGIYFLQIESGSSKKLVKVIKN